MTIYIITEEDLKRLRKSMDSCSDSDCWYEARLDDWEETLPVIIYNGEFEIRAKKD